MIVYTSEYVKLNLHRAVEVLKGVFIQDSTFRYDSEAVISTIYIVDNVVQLSTPVCR